LHSLMIHVVLLPHTLPLPTRRSSDLLLQRSAAAALLCPHHGSESKDPGAGRGDGQRGHRDGGGDSGSPGPDAAGTDHHRHRPPPLHHPGRRSDPGFAPGGNRRTGNPSGAAEQEGTVSQDVSVATGTRGRGSGLTAFPLGAAVEEEQRPAPGKEEGRALEFRADASPPDRRSNKFFQSRKTNGQTGIQEAI